MSGRRSERPLPVLTKLFPVSMYPRGRAHIPRLFLNYYQVLSQFLMKTTQQRKGLLDQALGLGLLVFIPNISKDQETEQCVCRFRFPSLGKITGLLSPLSDKSDPGHGLVSPLCCRGICPLQRARDKPTTRRTSSNCNLGTMRLRSGHRVQVDSELLHQLCSGFVSRHFTSAEERLPTNNRTAAAAPSKPNFCRSRHQES